jgi:endonuclease/exonuclease/phosphatase family metal-dependent hydrolase
MGKGMAETISLKAMTFNLRFDNPEDGAYAWSFRRERVIETVLLERPDLLATQEGMRNQLDYLVRNLPGYAACLPERPRDPEPRVQMPTIFFRTEPLALRACGEFWLSETPAIHRSKSWGAAFPRLFTYARFMHRPTKRALWFGDTHLDHVSRESRVRGTRLILHWARRKRLPFVLAGDFNDLPGSEVHGMLTRFLGDTWWMAKGNKEDDISTIHHFTGKGQGGRIDWILASPGIRVQKAHILDQLEGAVFPSDHFPYAVRLTIP